MTVRLPNWCGDDDGFVVTLLDGLGACAALTLDVLRATCLGVNRGGSVTPLTSGNAPFFESGRCLYSEVSGWFSLGGLCVSH